MHCKICDHSTTYFSTGRILNKYDVKYYCCCFCGYIQTQEPFWLSEAYQHPISPYDVGLISRNHTAVKFTQFIIWTTLKRQGNFLDYGGGNGLFVKLMRERGFNFYWYDKYSENTYSPEFKYDARKKYELLTAFEVVEHSPNPIQEFEDMLSFSDNILCSTNVLPQPAPLLDKWWYYGLAHGQHVGFFTKKSFQIITERFNLKYYSFGSFHFFSRKKSMNLCLAEKFYRIIFQL